LVDESAGAEGHLSHGFGAGVDASRVGIGIRATAAQSE
jgi:hypothetical protein